MNQYNSYFLRPNNFLKVISKKTSLILEFLELINKLFTLALLVNCYFMFDEKERIIFVSPSQQKISCIVLIVKVIRVPRSFNQTHCNQT